MKVAITIEYLNPTKGGQERSTLELAYLLAKQNIDTTIITARTQFLPPLPPNLTVVNFDIKAPRLIRLKSFIQSADRYVKKHHFDIIHSITPIKSANIYQPRGGLIYETFIRSLETPQNTSKLIKRIIGPNPKQLIIKHTEQYLAKNTPCIFLAVSEYVKSQFKKHLNLPPERIETIFNGIDPKRLSPISDDERTKLLSLLNIRPNQLILGFLANNFKLKGFNLIIQAANKIEHSDPKFASSIKFLAAGADKIKTWYNKVIKNNLTNTITFLGPVRNVNKFYSIIDALIHPTYYDPCSKVVLEATYFGLPVITSIYDGSAKIIEEANSGFILNSLENPDQLIQYLYKLNNPHIRKELSCNTEKVKHKITMQHHTEKLIALYKKILNKL